ncbi:zf-UBP-domain-containing protein [Hortaea werneckii]|nr:zf-UBP-domain-containing protein [Hortaea werneckii]
MAALELQVFLMTKQRSDGDGALTFKAATWTSSSNTTLTMKIVGYPLICFHAFISQLSSKVTAATSTCRLQAKTSLAAFPRTGRPTGHHTHLAPNVLTHQTAYLPTPSALNLPRDYRRVNNTPNHPPVPVPSLTAPKHTNAAAANDWRYDAVSIESIDMQGAAETSNMQAREGPVKSAVSGLHTKASYLPSNPRQTDVGYGVVHLYRDTEEAEVLGREEKLSRRSLETAGGAQDEAPFKASDCTTLGILAVPSWMMPSDLLGFVGDEAREHVSHFRLIRTGRANKYMVLMKFRSPKKAGEWQKAYNGRLFSAAEPENCHVVFIKSVEFLSPESEIATDSTSFPRNISDPFTPPKPKMPGPGKKFSSKPLAPPPPNLLELPTCPVCLERMDETTGLLTILCQHVFHSRPTPFLILVLSTIPTDLTTSRFVRFALGQKIFHFSLLCHGHQHAARLGLCRRWLRPQADPEDRHENEAFRSEGGDTVPREKMESMANEYTYLLTSQLEGQRRYFEEQVERAVDKASQASARAEEAASQASKASLELAESKQERESLSSRLNTVEANLAKSDKAKQKFEQMARDMSSKYREEKTMNEGLVQRIRAAEEKAEQAKKEAEEAKEAKKDLEEMNHDLTMFISSQEKVKELQAQGEEVEMGTASVPEQRKKGKGRKNNVQAIRRRLTYQHRAFAHGVYFGAERRYPYSMAKAYGGYTLTRGGPATLSFANAFNFWCASHCSS